jgi:hypothetical protein
MRDGTPTCLSVAAGNNISDNIILGLPLIRQTKMVIDTANQDTEMRAFDKPPFPVNF